MAATPKTDAADNVVALAPANERGASAARRPNPPRCAISATVAGPNSLDDVKLDQGPGALLAVLGDRSNSEAEAGETKASGPYALTMLNDVMSLALAGQKLTEGPLNADRVNAMLQQMSAFEPTDEVEAMLALQAVAMHRASMESVRRGLVSDRPEHRAQYLGQANKCSRTFAALLEQLNRHRGKTTTQRVIVENVTVQAGGQAVVGTVTGAGAKQIGAIQPHGQNQTQHDGGARCASMFSEGAERQTVPAACEQGQDTLPHAWRSGGQWSAEGKQEPAGSRPLLVGREGGPEDHQRDACTGSPASVNEASLCTTEAGGSRNALDGWTADAADGASLRAATV